MEHRYNISDRIKHHLDYIIFEMDLVKQQIEIAKLRMKNAKDVFKYELALEDLLDLLTELRMLEAHHNANSNKD